jgi:hypothetical protein
MWGARLSLYALALAAWFFDLMPASAAGAAITAAYLITGGHYTLYLAWHTGARDARGAFRYLRLLALVYFYQEPILRFSVSAVNFWDKFFIL